MKPRSVNTPALRRCRLATAVAVAGVLSACGDYSDNGGYVAYLESFIGTTNEFVAWGDGYSGNYAYASMGSYAGKRQFLNGTVDPVTGVDYGLPAGVEIYKANDGHVYVLDLLSFGTPVPQQVSTESAATVDDTCSFTGTGASGANLDYAGVYFSGDFSNAANSAYVYRLPGLDGVCDTADDVIHLVRTGMAATAAPLAAAAMPAATVHDSTGAITGYVAKSGATLVRLDVNGANPVVLGTFGATIGVALALPDGLVTGFPSGHLFVVDGSIVYVNYTAGTVSAPLFAIPGWTPTDMNAIFAAAPTVLYFAINTPAAGATPASATVYSMPADGSAAPTAVYTGAGQVTQLQFPVQSADLVIGSVSGTYSILALPLGSAAATPILSSTQNAGSFTATETAVYYTSWAETSDSTTKVLTRTGTQSGIVGIDGGVILAPLANSRFLAGGEAVPWPLDGSITRQTPLMTVFQLTGLTPVTVTNPATGWTYTADGASGANLISIAVSNNQDIAFLGTFPSSTATFLDAVYRSDTDTGFIEATTFLSTQDPATRDLYLLNAYTPMSLERVTGNL